MISKRKPAIRLNARKKARAEREAARRLAAARKAAAEAYDRICPHQTFCQIGR
jgi:hypothetical protein